MCGASLVTGAGGRQFSLPAAFVLEAGCVTLNQMGVLVDYLPSLCRGDGTGWYQRGGSGWWSWYLSINGGDRKIMVDVLMSRGMDC